VCVRGGPEAMPAASAKSQASAIDYTDEALRLWQSSARESAKSAEYYDKAAKTALEKARLKGGHSASTTAAAGEGARPKVLPPPEFRAKRKAGSSSSGSCHSRHKRKTH
jgi:hypothetical protein